MKYLLFPHIDACGETPDWVRVVHHMMDELLVQQNTIPVSQITAPVQQSSQHSQSVSLSSHMIDMSRLGKRLSNVATS